MKKTNDSHGEIRIVNKLEEVVEPAGAARLFEAMLKGVRSERARQEAELPTKLPHRLGSIQMRGANWWMVYRDAADKQVQENSWTDDKRKAYRLLAQRATVTLEARLAMLREIVNEGQGTGPAAVAAGDRGAERRVGRNLGGSVRAAAQGDRKTAPAKRGKGGAR